MIDCYIGLGSNLDDPLKHVSQAIAELQHLPKSRLLASSRLYRSKPMGPANQPDYINAVVKLATELSPHALLDELQTIEQQHQRLRTGQRWGPRTLDLDLLIYGNQLLNDERLVVPHAGLVERNFVLYPLSDVADGQLEIPGQGVLHEIIKNVSDKGLELLDR